MKSEDRSVELRSLPIGGMGISELDKDKGAKDPALYILKGKTPSAATVIRIFLSSGRTEETRASLGTMVYPVIKD